MKQSIEALSLPPAIVVGAGGQDGNLISNHLRGSGTKVISIRRGEFDLNSPKKALTLFRSSNAHHIYYLAAYHQSSEAVHQSDYAETLRRSLEVHTNGVATILEAMRHRNHGDRLFYAASCLVFAGSVEREINELTPMQPNCPYGISKAAGVEICRYYRDQHKVFASCGFLFNHESHLRASNFLSKKIAIGAARASRDRSHKITVGNLEATIDWTYAPEMVDAMVRTLRVPEPTDYVMCSGEHHSVGDFVKTAFQAVSLDWQQHVHVEPSLLKRKLAPLNGNPSRLFRDTGWHPSIPFEEWVGRMVRFEIENLC